MFGRSVVRVSYAYVDYAPVGNRKYPSSTTAETTQFRSWRCSAQGLLNHGRPCRPGQKRFIGIRRTMWTIFR